MVMFSGLVCVGMLTAFGISTAAIFLITGTVIRKMISSTSMMSTSGVVLISEIAEPSSSSLPTLIAMSDYLWWVKRKVPGYGSLLLHASDGRALRDAGTAHEIRMQVRREVTQAFLDTLVTAQQPVVTHDRGHGDEQAERRHD